MISTNNEMAFINMYVMDKEYFYPLYLRKALNMVHYLITKRHVEKALAIHITNDKFKKKYDKDIGKHVLRRNYNTRCAYIKNAKDKFKLWEIEKRERLAGIKPKLCECGCGQEVTKKGNRFIHGHHRRVLSQEEKNRNAKRMRDIRASKNPDKIIDFKSYKNL